jgi:hypothetical protein
MNPSVRLLQEANKIHTTTDALGRVLSFRRPTALDTLRLVKAAGSDLSQNDAWLSMAGVAFAVTSIDEVPIPQPTNVAQIENVIEKLGNDGVTAIASVLASDSDKSDKVSVGN